MNIDELNVLGFSNTESILYLALLRIGASDVRTLVKETDIYKANAYDALERLCEKGILSKVIEGNKRVYQIMEPNGLVEYIEKKKTDVETQAALAKKLAGQITLSVKHIRMPVAAAVFSGTSGVKQIYKEIVNQRLDYLVFGSPSASESLGQYYWQNLHAKQKELGIHARMIFHSSLRHWKNLIPSDIIELRFFAESLEPLTETTIYGGKVSFVVWTEKPVITIIMNEHVAASYRQVFEVMWRQAIP